MSTRQDGAKSPLARNRADLVGWIAAGEEAERRLAHRH